MKRPEPERLLPLTSTLIIAALSAPTNGASPLFQDFLEEACRSATPGSDFDIRCNVDTENGDLSGDSEDSLNPTQSLANGANAIAETRARIKALHAKAKERRDAAEDEDDESDVSATFRVSGYSLLLNGEDGSLERDASLLERGYETDTTKLQLGFDYRVSNNWIVGALVGFDRYDTVYDADAPGRNFAPGDSEGDSDAESIGISFFTSRAFGDHYYFDALASYSWFDYEFNRIGLYQESDRVLPTIAVNTSADTDGAQSALSIGLGMDRGSGANSIQLFARVGHYRSSIDSYTESGGAGFAMTFDDSDSEQTVASLGFRYARSINTGFGVLVPQFFVEYEDAFDSDAEDSLATFNADSSARPFRLTGDEPDDAYTRAGISLLGVFKNGWTAFLGVNKVYGQEDVEQVRVTGGMRIEL